MLTAPAGQWFNTCVQSVRWGPGCLATALPDALRHVVRNGAQPRALIVTGNSLATKTAIIKNIEALLGPDGHAGTFASIDQHASVGAIERAHDALQKSGGNVLLAVGGGSPIDSAKAISYWTYQAAHGEPTSSAPGSATEDPRLFVPIIAVPTTLSLAETTQNAGFTRDGKKTGVSHPALVPRAIIYDAELTRDTPERLWLSSGMRSLDHAVESLYRPNDPSPVLRNLWLGAIRDLFHFLPLSRQQPDDIAVRQRLQLACYTSLSPEARRGALGLSHGLGHALGSTYSIPHGITSCLTLAPSIRLTAQLAGAGSEQLEALSDALDYIPAPYNEAPAALAAPVGGNPARSEEEQRERGKRVGDAVQKLIDHLGLTSTLSQYKVPPEDLEAIAGHAAGPDGLVSEKGKGVLSLLQEIY